MEKMINPSKLLVLASALGCSMLFFGPAALAQQDKAASKKVQIKLYRNINGTVTEKDTLVEIAGDGQLPDLSELRKFRSEFTTPYGRIPKIEIKKLELDAKGMDRQEIEELLEKTSKLRTESKTFRIAINGEKGLEPGKAHRIIINGEEMDLDPEKIRQDLKVVENIRLDIKSLDVMKIDLKNLEDKNGIKMLTKTGDSLLVIRKVYFIKMDLTEDEKQLLEKAAKQETSAKKVKNLSLEAVNLYPNPTNGKFRVSFNAPQKGNTTVMLRDVNGRELYRDELGTFKGNYEKEFDLGTQPKGIYFVQVIQGKEVFNKKVMLQ